MSHGDQTGPQGMGPRTGRGLGNCGGRGMPGNMSRGYRGGRAAGGGGRHGHRRMFHATGLTGWERAAMGMPDASAAANPPQAASPQEELAALKAQAEAAAAALDHVRQRIDKIAAKTNTPTSGQ
jgi:hypothetical protein